ncbi:MAG TPA: hypothetical protein VFF06_05980 [Polyangia bacterium]|nr:hypothetical protein [Polyangia bacterium]
MTKRTLLVPCLALSLGGCIPSIKTGGDVDRKPMEVAIGAAASLGHSTVIAMNAMSKTESCAQVVKACSTFPCSGEVTITLGADCPLPLGGAATGTIDVTGMWTSATAASLSSTYTNVLVGSRSTVFVSSTNVTATPTSVMYTGQAAHVQGSAALAAQSTWNVSVDASGKYTVSGVQQAGGGGGSAQQLDVSDVTLDPACTLNPTGGRATIQVVNGLDIQSANITFHSACDGKADADGKSVPVDFLM